MQTDAIQTAPQSAAGSAKLTADFDMFLRMLTTQLQYQDPLDPMDTAQYTQQLVAYSQVEQAIQQTGKLEKILAVLTQQDLAGASALIGRKVGVTSATQVAGASGAAWTYTLPQEAAATRLTVLDANGSSVFTGSGETMPGAHIFNWNAAGAGRSYTLVVEAFDASGQRIAAETGYTRTVTGVEALAGDILLDLDGTRVPLADISSIRGPQG